MRILLILFMSLGTTACADGPPLATLRLPIAAALPANVTAFEVQIDGRVHRFDRPFATDLYIDVDPGQIGLIEAIGEGASAPVLWGQAANISVAEDATVDVDLVLDPAGLARVVTIDSLGPDIAIILVPMAPPPDTPSRYTLPFASGAYSRVVPAGDYRIRAAVDTGIGTPEIDIGGITVTVGAAVNGDLHLSELEMLADAF